MAIDSNAVTPPATLPQAPNMFGGLLANENPVVENNDDDLVSLVDEPNPQAQRAEDEAPSIVPDSTAEQRPMLSGQKAQERAAKAHFALGAESPGIEVLLHAVQEGNEASLRQRLADQESLKNRETRLQVIREKAAQGGNITPEDVAFMTAITGYDPKADPETIIERKFASTIVNSLSFLGPDPQNSPIAKAYQQNPEGLAQRQSVAEELMTRQEIVKNVLSDIESLAGDQSWGGWAWDTAKTMFPLYSALKLGWGNERSDRWLKGNVVQDMVNEYWSMPVEQMAKELRKDLSALAKDNVVLAREVAHAVLSHTSSEQFLDNAFTVLDAATFPGAGTALRGARMGAEAIATRGARVPLEFSKEAASDAAKAITEASEGTASRTTATVNGQSATSESGMARNLGWVKKPEDEVDQSLKDAVKANANPNTDAARQLNDMGEVKRAAELRATSRAQEILTNGGADMNAKRLAEEIPDFLRTDVVVEGLAPNLAQNMGRRLTEALERNNEAIAQAVADLVKVGRMPEEALQTAIQNEARRLQADFKGPEDAIIQIHWTRPDDNAANVGNVELHFGKKNGELFSSPEEAMRYVTNEYGISSSEVRYRAQGNAWYAYVMRHIDETDSLVRAKILTENNSVQPSLANTFLGWLRSGDDRVSAMQRGNRLAVVHGRSALEHTFRQAIEPIGRMSKDAVDELNLVMKKNRTEVDPLWRGKGEPPTGYFYRTAQEFAESFHGLHGKFPTEQQTKAYFIYKNLNDWEYIIRNMGVYRDKARMGTERISLRFDEKGADGFIQSTTDVFDGRVLKEMPWNASEDAGIVVHRAGEPHEYYRLKTANADTDLKGKLDQLMKEGYRLIQVDNPTRIPGKTEDAARLGDETINLILTKDVEVRPIDWLQIPYRQGWHTIYPQEWFVKQPKVSKRGGEDNPALARHVYEGDQAVLGFATEAEAKKYAQHMEQARKLLLAGDDNALEAFLKGNLPWDLKSFKSMFAERVTEDGKVRPPILDRNAPFLKTFTGNTTTDEHGALLRGSFQNFEDTVRSSWNRFQNVDKKFLGQRDDPLWTVRESGDELNPLLKLGNAEPIDPILAVSKAMSNIIRSRHFSDYKISHVEAWGQQFSKLLKVDQETFWANPVFHIHNPVWREDLANIGEVSVAKNSRRALLELLGTHSEVVTRLDHLRHQMLSSIYEKYGQSAVDRTANSFLYKADKDPINLMRKVAFHVNIGLFNPYQLVQNAATMVNAIAIAGPRNGFSGAAAALPMRYAFHNEAMLDKMAGVATSFGWRREHFKEAYEELKRTGKWLVEGEHTWKDDIADPPIAVNSMGQSVLDSGLTFFREGERLTRLTSWNAAYLEWRKLNPTKAIDDAVRRELMVRSDLMAANMTRASNSAWQQGIFSLPAQFLSYHTRLAEQMLGKRLTAAEKARLIALNSMMYGVPIGALGSSGLGALAGGQYPVHERVREEFLKRNIPMDDPLMVAFHGGMVNLLGHIITGQDVDLSSRLGPGGGQFFKNLLSEDKSFLEIIFGASGGKAVSIWNSLDPGMKAVMAPFRADEEQFPLRPEDAVDVLRNIKSVDHVVNVFYAMNAAKIFAKNGQFQTEISPTEAIFNALTGAQPRRLTDAMLMQAMNIDRAKVMKEVMKDTQRDADAMYKAYERGDTDTAQMYEKRIATRMQLADIPLLERAAILRQAVTMNNEAVERIIREFNTKSAPQSRKESGQQFLIDRDNKRMNAQ